LLQLDVVERRDWVAVPIHRRRGPILCRAQPSASFFDSGKTVAHAVTAQQFFCIPLAGFDTSCANGKTSAL